LSGIVIPHENGVIDVSRQHAAVRQLRNQCAASGESKGSNVSGFQGQITVEGGVDRRVDRMQAPRRILDLEFEHGFQTSIDTANDHAGSSGGTYENR